MSVLEAKFGTSVLGRPEAAFYDDFGLTDPEVFFAHAYDVLPAITDRFATEVIPSLEDFHGNWDPTGFMNYRIGIHERIGYLELHVWPGDESRILTQEVAHDHIRHIASLAIVGTYSDILVTPERNEQDGGQAEIGSHQMNHDFYIVPSTVGQTLTPVSNKPVKVTSIKPRTVTQGSMHHIKADVFHRPTIEQQALVATLSFNSLRVNKAHQTVILNREPTTFSEPLIEVSREESSYIKTRLLKVL